MRTRWLSLIWGFESCTWSIFFGRGVSIFSLNQVRRLTSMSKDVHNGPMEGLQIGSSHASECEPSVPICGPLINWQLAGIICIYRISSKVNPKNTIKKDRMDGWIKKSHFSSYKFCLFFVF